MASAAAMAQMTIYNMPTMPAKWDRIGIFYVAFAATWTTCILIGATILIANRHHPIVKMRGLGLSLTAVAFLHAYWILAQIVYPIGMTMDIVLAYDIQYFFMSIWFPLGIALFQAANSRFLYIAERQKQFTQLGQFRRNDCCNGGATSWICRFRNKGKTFRTITYIIIGMIIQVTLSTGMWFACKKYHPTFGLPGTEIIGDTLPVQIIELGRGWEWWPSVLWQFLWTWVVAPIILWRARHIHDTMGWRVQTIACSIAGLHATPMFLIASYVPVFYKVLNSYFPPSQWIHLSSMFIEIFTIFVPCYQVIRHKIMARKISRANAKWESSSCGSTTLRASTSAGDSEKGSSSLDFSDQGDRLFTIAALDHVLEDNPYPLLEFSALRDFSGENIAFLTRVSAWDHHCATLSPEQLSSQRRDLFERALSIYVDFISLYDAEFPVNIGSHDLKVLNSTFELAARTVLGAPRADSATPFDMGGAAPGGPGESDSAPNSPNSPTFAGSPMGSPLNSPLESCFKKSQVGGPEEDYSHRLRYPGEIPSEFDEHVFDKVQHHVKYLVLTNTWPKFVADNQRRRSQDSERTDISGVSDSTLMTRFNRLMDSIL